MRPVAALAAVAVILALAGCTSTTKGDAVTPADAKTRMLDLVHDSQQALGVSAGWRGPLGVAQADCAEAGRSNWGATILGPVIADRTAAIDALTALWKGKGMTVAVRKGAGGDTTTRVIGTGGPVNSIGVYLQANGTGIDGESLCFDDAEH